ncbi:MAG: methyltransferase domain-containing protein [Deltaproteobacteria bacterium]|nr:methyltransferase domain-containing protein [Deltaproteobacteria bacterium]
MGENEDYLLGTRHEELIRLAFQHRVWAEESFSLWARAGFAYGQTLLDLGCGPGFTSLDLAHLVGPQGRIVAVDSSPSFLDHLTCQGKAQGQKNIDTRLLDVHDLDLPESSLDGAYARWLFCFIRDPEDVVARVARALRPGAALAVTDYFNYRAFTFGPRSDAVDRVVEVVEGSWKLQGGDLGIQGRMPGLMARHGLEPVHVHCHAQVARPGSPKWQWPATFFEGFLPTLKAKGFLSAEEIQAFWEDWKARSEDSSSFLCLPPMYDVIGVKRP